MEEERTKLMIVRCEERKSERAYHEREIVFQKKKKIENNL